MCMHVHAPIHPYRSNYIHITSRKGTMQGGPRPDQAQSVTLRPNDPEWRWNPKAVEIQRCGDHDVGRVGEESSKLWKKLSASEV